MSKCAIVSFADESLERRPAKSDDSDENARALDLIETLFAAHDLRQSVQARETEIAAPEKKALNRISALAAQMALEELKAAERATEQPAQASCEILSFHRS